MLTSWAVRKRMIDELSERPEGFKRRSLARRLTKLDKALTDLEAYSLDRAFSAWLITAGKSKSVDVSGVTGESYVWHEAKTPLGDWQIGEIAKLREGLRGWPNGQRLELIAMFNLMAPWHELSGRNWSDAAIQQAVSKARLLTHIYVDDFNRGA